MLRIEFKQNFSNYISPRYGALHTPTLQETLSQSYDHSQYEENIHGTTCMCLL